jgi:hypothetical protein
MPVLNAFKRRMFDSQLALGDLKMMLLDDNHSTDIDTQEFIDDISANEVSSSGYTAGGVTLANPNVVVDNANDEASIDADNVSLVGITATVRYLAFYVDTGTPGTSPIINIYDLTTNQVLNNQDLDINFESTGIIGLA